ncbi:oxaloacetate decarboxylase, alpha subunit [Selenihalanaerobacter shriftii]|uniref:Oxaloacetate decarboxylase, alpha subunit n=2 Tax=Selenihalanaerobacter shriftii TaxID=142842 RepID=A0A1T4K2D1_9FIRM|nr:oxaloacetate decarboxylase subunit alpha [Selenihalanaerobacter shriftii]SJZ36513.1 oxaloacetate decarboxylase, alpha subunit [Selenihalanaerobacter shriftii]
MKVKVTETILRDGQQSLLATRMTTEDMLPALEKMDQLGYHSLEVWGGATFDSCLRYLDEDPWIRLKKIKLRVKNTPLQMLLRGQNILGYKHYSDDILEKFIEKSIINGIDIIRIFDALNDVRNMKKAIEYTKKYGGHAQGTIVYTTSPIHDVDYYVNTAKLLKDIGIDSLCIKDMAGLLTPYKSYELVKKIKQETDLIIQLHSHDTSGMAAMTYLKGVEAGVDIIDTAISALSSGTSQPATETMVAVLDDTKKNIDLDLKELEELGGYFREIRNKYDKYADSFDVDPRVLTSQIPGGMLSNLRNQLKEQNMLNRYDEVLKEVPKVRKEMGYPPLVTPTSQIIGTQAVFNVVTGERYSLVSKEIKYYVKGMYGRPPGEIDPEIKEIVLEDELSIKERPADLLEPKFDITLKKIKDFITKEEDVLSYILFPGVAEKFLKKHYQ